jgi:putative redox protein
MAESRAVVVELVDGMVFRVTTPSGHSLALDSSPDVGGRERGPRPMEMLLASLGSCTAMDVISILRKMRQEITSYSVRVGGSRASEHPRVFTSLTVEHVVSGRGVKVERVRHAVELSAREYCPAMAMLSRAAPIEVVFRVLEDGTGEEQSGSLTVDCADQGRALHQT